jgi:PHD/YefM family antitoxin component YafN of YafNO toxin-antitoxin module
MSAPQIIRTPSGEELVVLPRAEYEALLERADHAAEDAGDVAIYDARKAELATGGVGAIDGEKRTFVDPDPAAAFDPWRRS